MFTNLRERQCAPGQRRAEARRSAMWQRFCPTPAKEGGLRCRVVADGGQGVSPSAPKRQLPRLLRYIPCSGCPIGAIPKHPPRKRHITTLASETLSRQSRALIPQVRSGLSPISLPCKRLDTLEMSSSIRATTDKLRPSFPGSRRSWTADSSLEKLYSRYVVKIILLNPQKSIANYAFLYDSPINQL